VNPCTVTLWPLPITWRLGGADAFCGNKESFSIHFLAQVLCWPDLIAGINGDRDREGSQVSKGGHDNRLNKRGQLDFSTQLANLTPTNRNIWWSGDPKLHDIAFHFEHRDRDSSPDDDGFTVLSG
jgi:hypothetical protein